MNPIQQALRGTQETIRYIGHDQARSKRRLAESKLMGAQMEYKKEAAKSDLEFKQKEQEFRGKKLKLLIDADKSMKFRELLTINYGGNPEMLEKVIASFEQSSPGFVDSEISPKFAGEAFKAMQKKLGPKNYYKKGKDGVTSYSLTDAEAAGMEGLQRGSFTPSKISSGIKDNRTPDMKNYDYGVENPDFAAHMEKNKEKDTKPMTAATAERMRKVVTRQFSEEINATIERASEAGEDVYPDDVQKNPERYFSKESVEFFSAVEETALALKIENPNTSDITIAKKAKKMVATEYGNNLLTQFEQIKDPAQRKAFSQKLQEDPYTYKMFKDAVVKASKKKQPVSNKNTGLPQDFQLKRSSKKKETKKTPVKTAGISNLQLKKSDKKKTARSVGTGLMQKAREMNEKLRRLKSHTRENPVF